MKMVTDKVSLERRFKAERQRDITNRWPESQFIWEARLSVREPQRER